MTSVQSLKKLILTEDSYQLVQECDTIALRVARDKNKIEIKKAVEAAFGTRVLSVNTLITPSKKKTVRGSAGKKTTINGYKKAFVRIHKDDIGKIPLI